MAAALVTAGVLASVVLFEGLQAFLEHMEGDPEADVMLALRQLAEKNQRRAFATEAIEQKGAEEIERKFATFNRIPSRMLTSAALRNAPQPPLGPERDTGVLDWVSQQLGVTPAQLDEVSHPRRMGDMSQVHHGMGQSLPTGR